MKQSNALKCASVGVEGASWWDVIKAYMFMFSFGISLWAAAVGVILWVWLS